MGHEPLAFARQRHLHLRRRLRLRLRLQRQANARPVLAVGAVHHDLRRVAEARTVGRLLLALARGVRGAGEAVFPAESVPVVDMESQRHRVGLGRDARQPAVGRRAGVATFRGVQLDHRRHGRPAARRARGRVCGQRDGHAGEGRDHGSGQHGQRPRQRAQHDAQNRVEAVGRCHAVTPAVVAPWSHSRARFLHRCVSTGSWPRGGPATGYHPGSSICARRSYAPRALAALALHTEFHHR